MIDHFTAQQFEKELPEGWEYVGDIQGERCYTLTPKGSEFSVFVRSSVHGEHSAGVNEDSIRAYIVEASTLVPHGGKSQRWVDRRPGWANRMRLMITKLAHQIGWVLPCPHCGETLIPFTSRKGKAENKGRAFVTCHNPDCPYRPMKGTKEGGFFKWCEDENLNPLPPNLGNPVKMEEVNSQILCPICQSPMVRMKKGTGWRCSKAGKWDGKEWSGCQGIQWDSQLLSNSTQPVENGKKEVLDEEPVNSQVPVLAPTITKLSQPGEPLKVPQRSPLTITVTVTEVRRLLGLLGKGDHKEVELALRRLLPS